MRYLAEYIEPTTGRARLGTATRIVREYASDRNALRYMPRHLRYDTYPPGQYRLWAGIGVTERPVGWLYKTV